MTTHIALLRAVDVRAHQPVAMSDLCAMLTRLGFADARSLLQSGDLASRSNGRSCPAMERILESETQKRLGLATDFFVRSAEEWNEVVARNPFREQAEREPAHQLVMFAKGAPAALVVDPTGRVRSVVGRFVSPTMMGPPWWLIATKS